MANRRDQLGQTDPLDFSEVRVPGIHQQNRAGVATTVPGFMQKSVVECEGFAGLAVDQLLMNFQGAIFRHDQWKMYHRADIAGAVVRKNMGACRQHRETDFRRVFGDSHQRQ